MIQVTDEALKLIEKERNGILIESHAIGVNEFIRSLVTLGFNDHSNNRSINSSDGSFWNGLNVYEHYFEEKFLLESAKYYQREFESCVKSLSIPEYFKNYLKRFEHEYIVMNRLNMLPNSTTEKVKNILFTLYVPCNLSEIGSIENKALVDKFSGDIRHIKQIYVIFNKNKIILKCLKPILEQYIIKQGEKAINEIAATSSNNPKVYVETLIGVRNKFEQLMRSEPLFKIASMSGLDKACYEFFNYNAITKGRQSYSAKLFAYYCDMLHLKRGKNAEKEELDKKINEFMTCFKFLKEEEKDAFADFYCQLLATRLVKRSSVSHDTEASMIMKLTKDCDRDYIRKMEQLISDARESDDLNKQYYNQLATSSQLRNVKFSVQVFKSFAWPHSQESQINFPTEIEWSVQGFKTFYKKRHPLRSLKWNYSFSKGEIITNFLETRFTFTVNTFQMAILLQFNSLSSCAFQELAKSTGEIITCI